jgi:hypothetical protein
MKVTEHSISALWDALGREQDKTRIERRHHRAMYVSFAAGAGAGLLLATFTIGIWLRVAVLVLR